jgi:PKHD-type hydroxylase
MYEFKKSLPRPEQPPEGYFSQNYILWNACADHDMVSRINSLGESLSIEEAKVGGAENSTTHVQTRVSSLSWIRNNPESQFLFDFITNKVDSINYHHYGMDLTGMEEFQFTRYSIGGHYAYHNDVIVRNKSMRKLSIVMGLTDSSEYSGGNFLLLPHGKDPTRLQFNRGDLIAFPSWIPHKVEPVTEGYRKTLVTWIYGPTLV